MVENYRPKVYMQLVILPDVVVLPTVMDTGSGKNSNDGTINTDLTFDCNKISLRKGNRGDDVKKLQTILKAKGYYKRQIDGYYGNFTVAAVKKLQAVQGNTADGWFGPKTCQKLQQTSITSNIATGTSKSKQTNYIINDFENIPSITNDLEALNEEITLKTVFTQEKHAHIRNLQKTEFIFSKDDKIIQKHKGYIQDIKLSQDGLRYVIELRLVGYIEFLNQTVTFESMTDTRYNLVKYLIQLAGLKPVLDWTGLPNDSYTLNLQNSTQQNSSTSTGSKSVSDCFDMAKGFIHPYHDGKYQTGTSTHDPEKAYEAYQSGIRHFDCFGTSAFLFYVIKNFAKHPVRVIHRYSASAKSHTHWTVQIKENGSWIDPKSEYNKLDKLLRVSSGSIRGIHQTYEGG